MGKKTDKAIESIRNYISGLSKREKEQIQRELEREEPEEKASEFEGSEFEGLERVRFNTDMPVYTFYNSSNITFHNGIYDIITVGPLEGASTAATPATPEEPVQDVDFS